MSLKIDFMAHQQVLTYILKNIGIAYLTLPLQTSSDWQW